MTTIAYRDGIIASDSRAYSGDKHPIGDKQKVFALPGGRLVGISSSVVGAPNHFLAWLAALPADAPLVSAVAGQEHLVQALVVERSGEAFYWNDGRTFTGPIKADFYAIGSGQQTALAALELGKSAAEAIELAIKLDPWTGGEARTLEHPK